MQQHILVYERPFCLFGIINICNIEEVWLNELNDSVTIRYMSPNGNLVDHEEVYDDIKFARMRFAYICDALDCKITPSRREIHKHIKKKSED